MKLTSFPIRIKKVVWTKYTISAIALKPRIAWWTRNVRTSRRNLGRLWIFRVADMWRYPSIVLTRLKKRGRIVMIEVLIEIIMNSGCDDVDGEGSNL